MKPNLTNRLLAAALTFAVITFTASAADIYKVNNTNDLNLATSWSTTSGSQTPNPSLGVDNWYFNEVTMLGNKTVALGGDITMGGLALDYATSNTANNLVISSGNTLTLNGGTLGGAGVAGSSYTNTGIVLNRGTGGTLTINSNVALGANQSWVNGRSTGTGITVGGAVDLDTRTLTHNIVSGAATAISGDISGTGAAAILKTNFGTLTLSGTNSLTGTGDNLIINAGTVSFTGGTSTFGGTIKSSATSSKGTLNVSSGATVNADALFSSWGTTMAIDGGMNFTNAFTFSGGASTVTGSGTVKATTLTNTNVGTTNLNGARFDLGTGGVAVASGTLNLGATTLGAYANWSSSAALVLTNGSTGTTINTLDSVDGSTARTITLSGVLSGGSGKLVKAGAGTLILTNTNTYGGALVITGGTLQAGNGGATGTFGGAGDIAVSSGATLAVNQSGAFTFGRKLTGAGGFEQKGSGTTTFTLASDYTGATAVSNGRFNLTGSLTSAVSVSSGAKVSGTGSTTGLLTLAGGSYIVLAGGATTTSLTSNGVTFSGTTTITWDSALVDTTVYNVVTYGAGGVSGFGNLSANFRGTLLDDTGNQKITFTAGAAATRTWSTTSGTWAINSGTNFAEGDQKYFDGDTVVFGNIASDSAITLTGNLTPASLSITSAANTYTFSGGSIIGGTSLVKSGNGTLALNAANSYSGGTTISAGTVTTGNASALGTNTVTLNGGSLDLGGQTISNAIAANGGTLSGTGTASGSITGAVIVNTVGTITFNNQKSYTGGTTVDAGILNLTGGGGASGVIRGTATVNTGATLRLSTGDATGYNGGATSLNTINLVGGTLNVNTASNQTLGSATINMTGGSITGIAGSNLDFFGSGSALNTLASATTSTIALPTMNLRQNDTTFGIANGAAAVDLEISSVIGDGSGGNHSMIKNGAGTMKLTGVNIFTGNTTINDGVLDLTSTGSKVYNAAFNNTAVVTVNTGGTLRLDKFTYDTSLGKLADYAARRVINGGTIEVTGGTHGSGNDFTIGASGGTFRYNPTTTSDTLTLSGNGNGNIVLNGALTMQTDGNIVVTDVMEGAGSLTKTGDQTLTLNGNQTYTGITNVNVGTLVINGDNSAATGAVTVAANAALGGNGTVGGATTIQSGGIHGPGNSPDVQKFTSDLTYADGSIFSWEIDRAAAQTRGTGYDGVNVTGTLGGSDAIFRVVIGDSDFSNNFWTLPHTWSDIFTSDGSAPIANWTSIFGGGIKTYNGGTEITDTATYGSFSFTPDTNSLTWSAVPEPTSALAGLLIAAGLLRRRRVA